MFRSVLSSIIVMMPKVVTREATPLLEGILNAKRNSNIEWVAGIYFHAVEAMSDLQVLATFHGVEICPYALFLRLLAATVTSKLETAETNGYATKPQLYFMF